MSETGEQPCDFCGITEMSNTEIRANRTVQYNDGPALASIPTTVLCYECAEEVTDYLHSRRRSATDDDGGTSPFGEADVEALLERLEHNDNLVLQTDSHFYLGIRAVDGDWKRAGSFSPGSASVRSLDRSDVRDLILSSRRLTLKHVDREAWERYEGR